MLEAAFNLILRDGDGMITALKKIAYLVASSTSNRKSSPSRGLGNRKDQLQTGPTCLSFISFISYVWRGHYVPETGIGRAGEANSILLLKNSQSNQRAWHTNRQLL